MSDLATTHPQYDQRQWTRFCDQLAVYMGTDDFDHDAAFGFFLNGLSPAESSMEFHYQKAG